MKIFYHNDHDGQCSAYLVGSHFRGKNVKLKKSDFIECHHGMSFPFDEIKKNEIIYILDFSFKPDEMKKIYEKFPNTIWIDHHKTAIENNKDLPFAGLRISGMAACELTWIYIRGPELFENVPKNYKEAIKFIDENGVLSIHGGTLVMPRFVRLIGDMDTFRRKMEPDTSQFYYGLSCEDEHPWYGVWNDLNSVYGHPQVDELIINGSIVLDYINKSQNRTVASFGYRVKWKGKRCIVLNTPNKGSLMFKDFDNYDIMLVYAHRNDEYDGLIYDVSIYSNDPKIDVSEIAQEFGGGGHKGAAGFRCLELPWVVKTNKISRIMPNRD